MCSCNQFRSALTLAAAVTLASLIGCGGGAPKTGIKESFHQDFGRLLEQVGNNRAGRREDAIEQLERAWEAGELQTGLTEEELKGLRLTLAAKVKGDPSEDVRKAAKSLLKTMAAGEGDAEEEPPAE
jgi:hypothetical protein